MIGYILIYLAVINIIAFIVCGVDKSAAKKKSWRVPEKTLFLLAIVGGSIGVLAGMYLFRHKTKHWYFVWGIPAILVLQIVLAVLILTKVISFDLF